MLASDCPAGYCCPVELFFEGLLVVAGLAIAWFAIYVLMKLFKGQS